MEWRCPNPGLLEARAVRGVVCAAIVLAACSGEEAKPPGAAPPASPPAAEPTEAADAWVEMVDLEEVIHELRRPLAVLSRSVENLALPDPRARQGFDFVVAVRDLDGGAPEAARDLGAGIVAQELPIADQAAELAAPALALWRPLFERIESFDLAQFQVASARRDGDGIAAEVLFHGRGIGRNGETVGVEGKVTLRLRPEQEGGADDRTWRIRGFETQHMALQSRDQPLFRDVLDAVVPDPTAAERARRSRHEELVVRKLAPDGAFEPPHRHFFEGSQDRHPGVAIVDLDRDGDDDVYAMARWGANQLFVAQPDGSFREEAAARGLDLADHSSAALFADFDNDGDPDVFVGRTLARSVYLENVDGRFVDRSERALGGLALPALVSSLAAADVDGDGRLDLYVSTYAAQMLVAEMQRRRREEKSTGRAPSDHVLAPWLSAEDGATLLDKTRERDAHIFVSLPGPPNLLLRNIGGGRFEHVDVEGTAAWRNTYQATFADWDGDGDPDLYLAHDFAPNQLLRNDGGAFVDVTDETRTADIGFGMGASWGDYDRDGRLDLYVSNMYSKAGRRITSGFEDVDPRLPKMARGNSLLRNEGERFDKVSGLADPALLVEAAGWAWGGQFGDVDNDGHLDLFVLSGYYTAPGDPALAVDT